MHPLRSIPVYILVVIVLYFVAVHISHLLLNRLDDLPVVYRRLPYGLTFFTLFSIVEILMMRVVHFIGPDTLFHLVVGTYHRPVGERKVLLFLDINGSTALGEKLGGLQMRALVRKFLSDVARPIVDYGGDIYLYKGDGLIAIWDWDTAIRDDAILRAVDEMFAAVKREHDAYVRSFSVTPEFHIGIHGGDVVVSEQGDTKRSIGIYGDTINIAARMEEAARSHGVRCVISRAVSDVLAAHDRFEALGEERVKGISPQSRSALIKFASRLPNFKAERIIFLVFWGVKRTSVGQATIAACDPKRTFAAILVINGLAASAEGRRRPTNCGNPVPNITIGIPRHEALIHPRTVALFR